MGDRELGRRLDLRAGLLPVRRGPLPDRRRRRTRGSYSDPKTDTLIKETTVGQRGPRARTRTTCAQQLPVVWQPNAAHGRPRSTRSSRASPAEPAARTSTRELVLHEVAIATKGGRAGTGAVTGYLIRRVVQRSSSSSASSCSRSCSAHIIPGGAARAASGRRRRLPRSQQFNHAEPLQRLDLPAVLDLHLGHRPPRLPRLLVQVEPGRPPPHRRAAPEDARARRPLDALCAARRDPARDPRRSCGATSRSTTSLTGVSFIGYAMPASCSASC